MVLYLFVFRKSNVDIGNIYGEKRVNNDRLKRKGQYADLESVIKEL